MKVAELKDELEERGELKSGNKAWLRRRLLDRARLPRERCQGSDDDSSEAPASSEQRQGLGLKRPSETAPLLRLLTFLINLVGSTLLTF